MHTSALVVEHGLRSVTMSQIAEKTGIGRATLYKYFPDVETILLAWHEQQIAVHLEELAEVREQAGEPVAGLRAMLEAYANISRQSRGHGDGALMAVLHRDDRVGHAERQIHRMVRDLLAEGARIGVFRDDVVPDELATYCLHAVTAARALPSEDAVRRLVMVIMSACT